MYTSSGIVGFGQAPVLPSELPGGLKAGDPCPPGWAGTVPMCMPATYPGDQPQPQPQPQNLGCKPNETPYNYQGVQLCIPDCPEGQIPLHMPDGTIACQTPTQPEPDPNLILPSPTPGDKPAQPEPAQGGIGAWWDRRSGNEKLAIGAGGGLLAVAVLYSMFGKKKAKRTEKATANPRRGRRLSKSEAARRHRAAKRGGRARLRCAAVQGIQNCHCKAPAKYRRTGATKRSHYALPECWMYPLKGRSQKQTKARIRNAAARFAQYGSQYPQWAQRKMKKRINAAKRRHRIG